MRCQREMHLGGAPTVMLHVAQVGGLFLALAAMFSGREQTMIVDKAVKIRRTDRPAVALIFDQGMNGRDRVSLAVLDEFDAAEQRWRIGETDDIRQEPADFDRGIFARLHPAVD